MDPFTVIGDAIIMDDTAIGSHTRIINTVVGERCTLADHTSVSTAAGLMDIEGCTIRSEFGAILGDNVINGPFTLYKNAVVGNNVTIEGQDSISSRNIPDSSTVI
jgi:glucose-1-phosphate thymidylyltransferase